MANNSIQPFLILILIILILFSGCKSQEIDAQKEKEKLKENIEGPKAFTDEQLQSAYTALEKGIIIEDPENDYYIAPPGSKQWDKPDNPSPYPLPYTDLKSLQLGSDNEYLYVKFTVYGIFPEKMPTYEGDDLWAIGAKISEMDFITDAGIPDSAELIGSISYVTTEWGKAGSGYEPLEKPGVGLSAAITPDGADEHGETTTATNSMEGFVGGGPGTDYLLLAYPLDQFHLSAERTITFISSVETGSTNYHHESIDFVLGVEDSKSSHAIRYRLGNNTYEILEAKG